MEFAEQLCVRVKYEDDIKFIAVPVNDLRPMTFAFRGMWIFVKKKFKLMLESFQWLEHSKFI